MTIAVQVIFWL